MVGGLQLFLYWQSGWERAAMPPALQPFETLIAQQKKTVNAQEAATRQPPRLVLPDSMPLISLGNPNGEVLLTVFADPSLATHRAAIQKWLHLASPYSRLEVRFAATASATNDIDSGMASGILFAFARSKGLEGKVWQALQASGRDATTTEMMTLLAKLGVSLNELRSILSQPNPAPMKSLQPDIAWAAAHRTLFTDAAPVLLLEGYVVQPPLMTPERLGDYIQRRLKGEDLVQAEDFL